MAVTSPNIEAYVGEDKVVTDTIYQSDGRTLQSLVGWTITASIHKKDDPTTVYVTKTVGSGITVNTTTSVISITFTAANLTLAVDDYELLVVRDNSGFNTVLTKVRFKLRRR